MTDFPELTAEAVHPRLSGYRIVDVREAHELCGPLGRIEGALHVPLGSVAERAPELAGTRLLLVCRSGKRSAMACAVLRQHGAEDVTNLAGGMIGWNLAALPVAHDPPASLAALVERILAWLAQLGAASREELDAVVAERFAARGTTRARPTRAAVRELLRFAAESLEASEPPDLDLGLAAFHRWLAAL